MTDSVRVVKKATCMAVHRGNEVLASFVGPECQEHAELFAASLTRPQEVAAPVGLSRAEWIAQAKAFYVEAGDDDATARECARYICNQQDWAGAEIGDPRTEAQEDIHGRGRVGLAALAASRAPVAVWAEAVKYVPVNADLRTPGWNHPNDDEPRGDALKEALKLRGDDKGQGLDGYWKWGFCAGFNAATPAAGAGGEVGDRCGCGRAYASCRICAEQMPRHTFWGAGEPDCPHEIKAPNGELHTMRCKVCGDGWRKNTGVCIAPTKAEGDGRDAERWVMFSKALGNRNLRGAAHGRRFKIVETCPVTGDEKEFDDFIGAIDAAIAATSKTAAKPEPGLALDSGEFIPAAELSPAALADARKFGENMPELSIESGEPS